jgi:hypothetical protein
MAPQSPHTLVTARAARPSVMGRPDMAPQPPHTLVTARRSRAAPRERAGNRHFSNQTYMRRVPRL